MAGFGEMMSFLDEQLQAGSQIKIAKTYRWLKRSIPMEETRVAFIKQFYDQFGQATYLKLNEVRQAGVLNLRSTRNELRRLGYPISELKNIPEQEMLNIFREKRKWVDPQQAINDKERAHYVEARSRHKVITEKSKEPTMPEATRIDQKSARQRTSVGSRNVKDVDQSKIRTEKRNSRAIRKEYKLRTRLRDSVQRLHDAKYGVGNNIYTARRGFPIASNISDRSPIYGGFQTATDIQTDEPIFGTAEPVNARTRRKIDRAKARGGIEERRKFRKTHRAEFLKEAIAAKKRRRDYYKAGPGGKIAMDMKRVAENAKFMFDKLKGLPIAAKGKALITNKWFRRGAKGAVGIVAFNLISGGIQRLITPRPAIPAHYERGYDLISEYTSDYGSPINLSKATHKVLRPYYSTARRALVTDVNAVIKRNYALSSYKNAIGHMRY